MFRSALFAVLCLAAAPALAQNETAPAPSGPPADAMAAIQQAGMAFGQCVQAGIPAVPATVTPEAGATSVLNGCSTQRQALDQAAAALVAAMPEAQRPMVQEQVNSRMGGVQAQVVAAIRASRTPPAATPAPAPAQ